MEEIEVYKVLMLDGTNELLSAFDLGRILTYAPNQTTVPEEGDGPMAAFDDIHGAVAFKEKARPLTGEVWKARAIKSEHEHLWIMQGDTKLAVRIGLLPSGTVLCDSITITERVA